MHILQHVTCPEDRGDKPYEGRIMGIGNDMHENAAGVRFRWLTVQRLDGQRTKHVWPSNRLGFKID